MALNISAWSIRNPLPSIVFSIILLVLGWVSFTKLAVTRLPSADIPVISVAVAQFGAAPAELESQVTKTIEDGVSGVEGVRHISSSITDGLSVTTIQFALETNTDRALNDVKDAVTRVRANLPQNVNEPLIQRVDVIGLPIVTYAAISPGKTPEQLSYFVDDVVKRALQGVRGVAQVERIGGVEREILVSLDPDRLQAAGLTAVNVSQILRGTNVDVAGGRAQIGKNDQAIRTLAGAKTLNELAGTMIPLFGGGEMRLDDLGTVTDTIADRSTFARFNGEPVVALGIKRSKGASDVVVAAAVQKRIDALKVSYPDVDLKLIDTSVEFTKGNYDAAISTLFEGAILAVIVVLLFLRDIRATIIAAISLPLSIFPAFWAMDMLGFSLNLVSFLAITLSTGILVDDAIVEIENIVRHMRMGKSPYRAALEAADEIGLAVIAISLTIIAIFAPASFMSGIAGQFFKQFRPVRRRRQLRGRHRRRHQRQEGRGQRHPVGRQRPHHRGICGRRLCAEEGHQLGRRRRRRLVGRLRRGRRPWLSEYRDRPGDRARLSRRLHQAGRPARRDPDDLSGAGGSAGPVSTRMRGGGLRGRRAFPSGKPSPKGARSHLVHLVNRHGTCARPNPRTSARLVAGFGAGRTRVNFPSLQGKESVEPTMTPADPVYR
jgi:multidrug efflux pump subunit AcrB